MLRRSDLSPNVESLKLARFVSHISCLFVFTLQKPQTRFTTSHPPPLPLPFSSHLYCSEDVDSLFTKNFCGLILALFSLLLHVLTAARRWGKNTYYNNYTRSTHYQAGIWGRVDIARDVAVSQKACLF